MKALRAAVEQPGWSGRAKFLRLSFKLVDCR
jgi:hypothetical protein